MCIYKNLYTCTTINISPKTPPQPSSGGMAELRTGRWTAEETAFTDKLIQKFQTGRLPLPEGIKLNEFLSNMLKSKQSRLTKKMKNAKLSSKTFTRTTGYLTDIMEGREFSESEDAFFHSIQNGLDRSEIKFHMQKEWRETFSAYCVSHGQPLIADKWLESFEEMERRVNRAKDAERCVRRKMMMGHALKQDSQNPDRGVVIVNNKGSNGTVAGVGGGAGQQITANQTTFSSADASTSISSVMMDNGTSSTADIDNSGSQSQGIASPFLNKIMSYVHRNNVPFEYVSQSFFCCFILIFTYR